jgi:hypothetical protein
MPWKKMLAWVTGQVEDSLSQKLAFVLEENRVYRALLDRHSHQCRLQDTERKALAQKGRPLGGCWPRSSRLSSLQPCLNGTGVWWPRSGISQIGAPSPSVARPSRPCWKDSLCNWPRITPVGAMIASLAPWPILGHQVSDQTVGNILRRFGLGPAPEREHHTTWAQFIRRHKDVLWATDFFTAEVWSITNPVTVYVLFFIHLQTRKVILGGLTPFPNELWVKQIARNVTGATGELAHARYLIHDRDTKFTEGFDQILHGAGIEASKLPPQSPNLNAYAERWIRSLKSECLEHLILFGERSLAHVLHEYLAHHQQESNHQGLESE